VIRLVSAWSARRCKQARINKALDQTPMASRDKAAYGRFPNEILTEIIKDTSQADQISLCLASKRFHGICLPVLYRVVHLVHYAHAVHFCAGVVDNPTRGNFIREFSVDCLREPLRHVFQHNKSVTAVLLPPLAQGRTFLVETGLLFS
jgi:hypothetical protein